MHDEVARGTSSQENGELIAAEACRKCPVGETHSETLRGGEQALVAGLVAERVVDRLKVVEVDEEESGRFPAGECLADALHQQAAVGEVREGVVVGLVGDARKKRFLGSTTLGEFEFRASALGHVAGDHHDAGVGAGGIDAPERLRFHVGWRVGGELQRDGAGEKTFEQVRHDVRAGRWLLGWGEETHSIAPNHEVGRDRKRPLEGGVAVGYAAGRIHEEDEFGRGIKNQLESFFTLADARFGRSPPGDLRGQLAIRILQLFGARFEVAGEVGRELV